MTQRHGQGGVCGSRRHALALALLLPMLAAAQTTADPVRSAPAKPDTSRPDPIKSNPIKSDPIRPDPVRPDPIQPIVDVRDTGYLLGDLLDERVTLHLPAGTSVDPDSLPLPGRVAPWMELRAARIDKGAEEGTQHLVVTYQIFAETEQAARVPIPAFKLRLRTGTQTRALEVPAKSFLLSPALPATLADEDRELKPSPAPLALSSARPIQGLLLSLIVALVCGAYLLWAHDRLPFLPRAPGPFARLWRKLRRARTRRTGADLPPQEIAALLQAWHVALNQSAGETLYRTTLPTLFERAPYLAPLRPRIEALFDHSWKSFYGPAGGTMPSSTELLEVLRLAAAHERGVPC